MNDHLTVAELALHGRLEAVQIVSDDEVGEAALRDTAAYITVEIYDIVYISYHIISLLFIDYYMPLYMYIYVYTHNMYQCISMLTCLGNFITIIIWCSNDINNVLIT